MNELRWDKNNTETGRWLCESKRGVVYLNYVTRRVVWMREYKMPIANIPESITDHSEMEAWVVAIHRMRG